MSGTLRNKSGADAGPVGDSGRAPSLSPESGIEDARRISYAIRIGNEVFPLRDGDTLLGRGSACHVGLDGPLVSRTHARLTLRGARVTITDLGSRNGVWLRGRRIQSTTVLAAGDEFVLGDARIEILSSTEPAADPEGATALQSARTLTVDIPADLGGSALENPSAVEFGPAPSSRPSSVDALSPKGPEESTRSAHVFELLGLVVDKALALGRTQEAVKILSPHLERLVREARAGQAIPPAIADVAAGYLAHLADSTLDGHWLNLAIELFTFQCRTFPLPVIDRLYGCIRKLRGTRQPAFREYVLTLQRHAKQLSASERFALKRLEGLVRQASL